MYTAIPECQRLSEVCANDISNTKACVKAAEFCEDTQTGAFYASVRTIVTCELRSVTSSGAGKKRL